MKKIVVNFNNDETYELPNLCALQVGADVWISSPFDFNKDIIKAVLTSLELFLLDKGFTVNDLRSIDFVKI